MFKPPTLVLSVCSFTLLMDWNGGRCLLFSSRTEVSHYIYHSTILWHKCSGCAHQMTSSMGNATLTCVFAEAGWVCKQNHGPVAKKPRKHDCQKLLAQSKPTDPDKQLTGIYTVGSCRYLTACLWPLLLGMGTHCSLSLCAGQWCAMSPFKTVSVQ